MKEIFTGKGLKIYWTLIFMMNADLETSFIKLMAYNP